MTVFAIALLLLIAAPDRKPTSQAPQAAVVSIGEPIELTEDEMRQVTGPTATQAELEVWKRRLQK